MAKVLACPQCGAREHELYAAHDATVTYGVMALSSAPDGIKTHSEDVSGFKDSWRMGCGRCGFEDVEGHEPFGEGWLVEEHEVGQDRLACTVCGDSVAESKLREHLELHASDARDWSNAQVRDAFSAED